MWQLVESIIENANAQWVLVGTSLLGLASGVLGSLSLLRKQSLVGDAVAHAALPGICLAFLVTGEKMMLSLILGALVSGLLAAYLIQFISEHSKIKEDSAIGLVLSVFFGIGIVLLTYIAQSPSGNKSGLNDFIFGKAAAMVGSDVKLMAFAAAALVLIVFLLFKEFKVLTFDPQFAKGLGLPTGFLNVLFMTLLAVAVVIGIQAIGVVLMAALLITPPIAARYWTESLSKMVMISGAVGALSGVSGTLLSMFKEGLPTGPFIVVSATGFFLVSFLFAPKRGLVTKAVKRMRVHDRIVKETIMKRMYSYFEKAALQATDGSKGMSLEDLAQQCSLTEKNVMMKLDQLQKNNLVNENGNGYFFTEIGLKQAYELILNERMYEICLMYRDELAGIEQEQLANNDWKKEFFDRYEKVVHLLKLHQMEPKLKPIHGENEV